MTRRVRLHTLLIRRWVGFTLGITLLLLLLATLGLYIVEDHFFNQRLKEVSRQIHRLDPPPVLPSGFRLHAPGELPADLHARLAHRPEGALVEGWTREGRYVHALWGRTPGGLPFGLVHDVTDELTVNAGLKRYGPWMFATMLAFLCGAWMLARGFIRRIRVELEGLQGPLQDRGAPEALFDYARRARVEEFREVAQRSAEAWRDRLEALAQERQTLAFLAHELASPLQSARASLEVLGPPHSDAELRLHRAITRLQRVRRSIQWLESDPSLPPATTPALLPLVQELLEEMAPLARQRGTTLRLDVQGDGPWPAPPEVLETLGANLLLNALQHGGEGPITVRLEHRRLTVSNPMEAESQTSGTGLGLQIVTRWASRFGLEVDLHRTESGWHAIRVGVPAGSAR